MPLLIHQNEVKEINFEIIGRTGNRTPVLVNTIAQKSKSGKIIYRSTIVDITQRKRYEKELFAAKEKAEQLANELKKANQELEKYAEKVEENVKEIEAAYEEQDNLISIIAHDLKSPFNLIYGLSDLVKSEVEGETAEFNDMIKKIAADSRKMIVNLVCIKSYEQSGFKPEMRKFNLRNFYQLRMKSFSKGAMRKNITLKGNYSLDNEDFISEENAIGRIVDNILSNAIKFSPKDKRIEFNLFSTKEGIIFVIQDEGQGFSEEDKTNAFKKFQKLSAKPTGDESSSGLGLCIIQMLVKALRGTISLESEKGKGDKIHSEIAMPN